MFPAQPPVEVGLALAEAAQQPMGLALVAGDTRRVLFLDRPLQVLEDGLRPVMQKVLQSPELYLFDVD